jgi:aminomethyltransferase
VDLDTIGYYRSLSGSADGAQAIIARTGYTGEDGFELIVAAREAPRVWERLLHLDVSPAPVACGLGARDTLRLEAGMALYGHEIDESTNPFEARLGRVVKLEKGDFVGRAGLLEAKQRGPARALVGFELVEPGVPRQGYEVQHDGRVVGRVTSGGFSPSLKRSLGMAYVPPALAEPGQDLAVVVRGRPARARVVPLPFYPHRTRRGRPNR